jgi:hypothetical protein
VDPLKRFSSLSPVQRAPSPAVRESGRDDPADRVELAGAPQAELMRPTRFDSADLGKKLARALLATATLTSAAAGMMGPTVVYAQAPDADMARLRAYGLSESTSRQILSKPELVEQLKTLPQDVVARFGSLNANQRRVLGQEIQGKTRFGLVVVQHREAFVKGKAMGMDAFPRMIDKLEEHVKKGSLSAREGAPLIEAVEEMRALTPAQRESIATILVLESAPLR